MKGCESCAPEKPEPTTPRITVSCDTNYATDEAELPCTFLGIDVKGTLQPLL